MAWASGCGVLNFGQACCESRAALPISHSRARPVRPNYSHNEQVGAQNLQVEIRSLARSVEKVHSSNPSKHRPFRTLTKEGSFSKQEMNQQGVFLEWEECHCSVPHQTVMHLWYSASHSLSRGLALSLLLSSGHCGHKGLRRCCCFSELPYFCLSVHRHISSARAMCINIVLVRPRMYMPPKNLSAWMHRDGASGWFLWF